MKESIELTTILPADPKAVYEAWLESSMHSEMTGGEAMCTAIEGAPFSAWDGYITGTNQKLIAHQEINQLWRTSEFSDTDENSLLTVKLQAHEKGTEITLLHSNIPEGQTQYIEGWKQHYFEPMEAYFNNKNSE